VTGPLATRERELAQTRQLLARLRATLAARGLPARSIAFTSAHRGADIARLAGEERVDLLLLDGRRPLLGAGVPRGDVGAALGRAPCDVAVLVDQERVPVIDGEHPVYVAFGGGEHDRAALEIATRIASGTGAPLRQLGPADRIGEAARGGGLLVVGLPEQWQKKGLGRVRAALATGAPVATLFVRSGGSE